MQIPSSEVATTLDMSQSTVSRMRAGKRIASVETLQKIAEKYEADPTELLAVAGQARHKPMSERQPWIDLLARIFDDGEPDQSEPEIAEPELVN